MVPLNVTRLKIVPDVGEFLLCNAAVRCRLAVDSAALDVKGHRTHLPALAGCPGFLPAGGLRDAWRSSDCCAIAWPDDRVQLL